MLELINHIILKSSNDLVVMVIVEVNGSLVAIVKVNGSW